MPDEETPLLSVGGTGSFSNWRQPVTDAEVDDLRKHFNAPSPFMLILMNMGMALGYSAYVLTSWLYTVAVFRRMFPLCAFISIHSEAYTWYTPLCKIACLGFWLLPLFCIFVICGIYYRNCLQTQLYYEMAAQRILLDYSPIPFFRAISIWILIAMIFLSTTMYFYYEWSMDSVIYRVKFTVPYWIPLLSFFGQMYAQWDLEAQLVSVSKVVEKDLAWAQQEFLKMYLVRDYVVQKAWTTLKAERKKQNKKEKMNHAAWIKALVEECAELERAGISKPRTPLLLDVLSPRYWVTDFLLHDKLHDERSQAFHRCLWLYRTFVIIMLLFVTYLAMCTFFTVFQHITQDLLGKKVAWWLSVGPMTAVDPADLTKDEHYSTASITTTTTAAVAKAARAFAVNVPH